MPSNSRRQIETWLSTLEIQGSVVDIGGIFLPIKGRTKTWDATEYKIVDIKESRKGIIADYVADLNFPIIYPFQHDIAFCIEVTDHFWNPVVAFTNINSMLKPGGLLYLSSNFIFPHHTGFDCIRLTETGIHKILKETGFEVLHTEPRFAKDILPFGEVMRAESKVYYSPGEIGYEVTARKNG